jgi:uncharacterized protein
MKLHADPTSTVSITAHGPGWVAVNGQRHGRSVVIDSQGTVQPWAVTSFDTLTAADLQGLADARPEIVLLGSGQRQRFVHPALLAPLHALRVGVETMDTAAACRTFNVLAAEGRRVVAALLIEPPASDGHQP